MQQVANCPDCDASLGLPELAPQVDGTMQAHCPACGSQFPLTIDRLSVLPVARLTHLETTDDERVLAQQLPSLAEASTDEARTEATFAPREDMAAEIADDPLPSFEPSRKPENNPKAVPSEPVGSESTVANFSLAESNDTLPTLAELLDRRPTADEPEQAYIPKVAPAPARADTAAEETSAGDSTRPTLDKPTDVGESTEDEFVLANQFADEFVEAAFPASTPAIEPAPTAKDVLIDLDQPQRIKAPAEPSAETLLAMSKSMQRREQSFWAKPLFVTAGGVSGLAIGYFLLMLIGGPSHDVLNVASLLPPSALPVGFSESASSGSDSRSTASRAEEPASILDAIPAVVDRVADLQANADEPLDSQPVTERFDPATQPAAFNTIPQPAVAANKPASLRGWMADSQRFGLDQLNAALEGAVNAAHLLGEHSLAEPEQIKSIGLAYAKLSELAQVVSLLDEDSSEPGLAQRRLEALGLFRLLFRSMHVRGDSRQIASRWIAWQGRPHGGIFFSGIPTGLAEPAGDGLYRYEIELDDNSMTQVVTPEKFEGIQTGTEELLIIGAIVEDPSEHIGGYQGDASRIVWRAASFVLGAADQP